MNFFSATPRSMGDDRAARGPSDRLTVAAIAVVAYALANVLHEGLVLVAISAAPASLGGTSGLAWGPQYLRGNIIPRASVSPTAIPRNTGWIVAAAGVGLVFVAILGPGITFGKS
jgi:hypothetical protein